jgi:putative oxidoreductase
LNRPLPLPVRDWALLLARILIGVVMFAHGYQKMMINGIGRTAEGFESLSIRSRSCRRRSSRWSSSSAACC